MDKSWMQVKDRLHPTYRQGVKDFLVFAYANRDPLSKIPCPCVYCNNFYNETCEIVQDHLLIRGIVKSYTRWIHHGEDFEYNSTDDDDGDFNNDEDDEFDDNMSEMLHDVVNACGADNFVDEQELTVEGPFGKIDFFSKLLRDAKQQLYPGCEKLSQLSFIVKLLHIKCINGWSNKSFDMVLDLFKCALPTTAKVPKSYYEAKKIIKDLGHNYIKIHVCIYDCALFWKEYANWDVCPICRTSRWKFEGSKKIPQKVLRYFPLKPRLKRLFVNSKVAEDMRWHNVKRADQEGTMRHPADSETWKSFDRDHKDFAADPQNVRLGLASDGFNPFGIMSNAYSMWPVILVPYNLPPWRCMKEEFFMLSMLIPGPNAPGNDIDVFLQPLIYELKELWEDGIEAYDAYTNQNFRLRATLLWTINDFPAYANLSGWSTKGYMACPICMCETSCLHLTYGNKLCYMGHRRFLPTNHAWRKRIKAFDGKKEFREKVEPLSGEQIFCKLNVIQGFEFGKEPGLKKRKRKRTPQDLNWTKKSIFFELPYWKTLKLRHNLDVMHIEKNICDNVLGTLMNIDGKCKDSWKARKDLEEMGIRHELHLRVDGNSLVMPSACYNLSHDEQKKLCEFLTLIKFSDGFASNISRCVKTKECRISGMKSHDCHVFLQRILPLAIRGLLHKDVCHALTELSYFFRNLCSRTLHLNTLEMLERQIVVTLCKLEQIFPPAFFDVMVHLSIHLAYEAKLAGPVQFRWMYPFERYMRRLKSYVRNKARPEGSIAEGYIDNECMTFCSLYLQDIKTRFNHRERNYDGGGKEHELSVFSCNAHAFGGLRYKELNEADWEKAHMYVLNNCEEVEKYMIEHKEKLKNESTRNVEERHISQFPKWFEQRVKVLYFGGHVSKELFSLSRGPDRRVMHYTGCNINGLRFHTKGHEIHCRTQNSGLAVNGEHGGNDCSFYGVINDIIELKYSPGQNQIVLFKCDWWDLKEKTGLQIDKDFNITSVNMSQKWYTDQPFVMASQAQQVIYIKDMKLGNNWHVVELIQPRCSFDVLEKEESYGELNVEDPYQQDDPIEDVINDEDVVVPLQRDDIDPIESLDASAVLQESLLKGNKSSLIDVDTIEDLQSCSDTEIEKDNISIDDDSDSE